MKKILIGLFLSLSSLSAFAFSTISFDDTTILDLSINRFKSNTLDSYGNAAEFTYSTAAFNLSLSAVDYHEFVDSRVAVGIGILNLLQLQLGRSSEVDNFIRFRGTLPVWEKNEKGIIIQLTVEIPFEDNASTDFSLGIGLTLWD